jgi:predicted O-linked N-acetylglucosamine transferase (SPINDLY family)
MTRDNQAREECLDNPPNDVLRRLTELYQKGAMQDLINAAQPLLLQFPNSTPVLTYLGIANLSTGKFNQARAAFERVTQISPNDPDAHNNLGIALNELGQREDAIAVFKHVLSLSPNYVGAYNNMGNALRALGRVSLAVECFNKALAIRPNYPEAYNNLGNALRDGGRTEDAIAAYQQALGLRPAYADALNNLAGALADLRRRDEAIECYTRALAINPNHATARAEKLHQQAHICDWDGIAADAAFIPQLGVTGDPVSPFAMLPLEDAPDRHRIRSERWVQKKYLRQPLPPRERPSARPERLRIGYFSGDFFDHATMYLMAKLFETHDRSRFSLHAFSYGPPKQDVMRARAEAAFDHFHDVRGQGDQAVAELVRREAIDIAVDLKGHTTDARLGVLAHRPAPVQMSYIGYPGTIGAPFIDYIVADATVIPTAQRQHYAEKIVFLPHSYQANDNARAIADRALTRAEAGLPERGLVFCCFNNSFKITPAEFDIWMRLLRRTEGSVLWLLEANRWVAENLRTQAERRGVDPSRIVFAPRAPAADHLARHRLADLFLDTFNYNAHTTASDALWAGLPLVTKAGQGFAARVGASLLTAAGLPELITEDDQHYEALALALSLANDAERLRQIKSKLVVLRATAPLFDTDRFARALEAGYDQAYGRYLNGEAPDDIAIAP